jgi:hypothetical protein
LLAENNKAFDYFAANLHLQARPELYGLDKHDETAEALTQRYGSDTRTTGKVATVLQSVSIGDQLQALNLSTGEGQSLEADKMRPDAGVPDPLGEKMATILLDVGAGAVSQELSVTLKQEGITYDSPHPTFPGGTPSG